MPSPIANLADAALVFAILVFAWLGYRKGFAESVWGMLRWVLILAGGALSWAPLGGELHSRTGLPQIPGAIAAYLLVSLGIAWLVASLQRFFSARLLMAIPMGRVDGALGLGAGVVTGAAIALVFLALLNPVGDQQVEWNPTDPSNDDALTSLFQAIGGSIHRAALKESAIGRFARDSLPGLLIGERTDGAGLW